MPSIGSISLNLLPLYIGTALGDRYASNQNPVVVDSSQVAANFPNIEGVEILAPAFLDPGTIPSTWSNGTSGPTPQNTLESYVRTLADRNEWIQYHSDLVSEEGRSIPYVTLSNPNSESNKLRIWIQGGQHGDEPAGDQGVLALLGKFASNSTWAEKVLEKIDLVLLPRYNADGVEYFQRILASNYDPNRDHAVLNRQQTRAIRQVQSAFDPHIFVDAHEYTGVNPVAQRYIRAQDLLVSGNKNPNIPSSIRALNDEFVAQVFAAANKKGLRTAPYFTTSVANGTITIQEPDWHNQANHKAAGNYQALTFLVETRGIRLGNQHFQRRVAAQLITLETIISKAVVEFDAVHETIESGRKEFVESKADIVVLDDYAVTSKEVPFIDATSGAVVNVTVRSQNYDHPPPFQLLRPRPRAYIFSRAFTPLATRLRTLGVEVSELSADWTGSVEALVIETAEVANSTFEGIAETTVTTRATEREVRIPKAGYWVDTAQKNGGFAFVALEPEGVASLVRYNVLKGEVGDEVPVFRVF